MNCSACHTAEITYQGKTMRIEGGPTLADFRASSKTSNKRPGRNARQHWQMDRFAPIVLKGADSADNRARLKQELGKLIDWQLTVEKANETPLRYGFARLDAFGHIFNKVLLRTEASGQPKNPSDAPVSYPFLWNIHQQDKVQWNEIAPSVPLSPTFDLGALGRNMGEVVGVFADLKLEPVGPAIRGYRSSANVENLVKLEEQIAKLLPPVWPDVLPPIDAAKWEAGKALFNKEPNGCHSCHEVLARGDLRTKVEVEMTRLIGDEPIGTDPWMACNAYTYEAKSGVLLATPKKFFPFSGPLLKQNASIAEMLGTTVAGALWNKKDDVLGNINVSGETIKQRFEAMNMFDPKKGPQIIRTSGLLDILREPVRSNTDRAARLKRCLTEVSPVLAYKGRPLTGVWATPPYLHNGSVPTLYDLLLPPGERPVSFTLGTREFDPEKVGYVTDKSSPQFLTDKARQENTFTFQTHDTAGKPIPGNDNGGHDYGNAGFSTEQRMALVEYMKAVGGRRVGDKIVH